MKKNICYILLSIATLTLASCLDDDPKSLLPENEAYGSASNLYNNAVATLYNYVGGSAQSQGLEGTPRGVYDFNTFTTDEAIIPIRGGDWYDGGFWQRLYLHTWTASDDALRDTWNYLYKVIGLCNHSLAEIDENSGVLTVAQRKAFEAEVRGLRALYYYELMDMFGRIPLVLNDNAKLADVKQSERSEAFRAIVSELQDIVPYLPDEHSNKEGSYYGRFTRPVAYYLLARLMLNAEVYADDDWTDASRPEGSSMSFDVDGQKLNAWQACIYYCNKIEGEGYKLEADYAQNFKVHNENSQENIFTIPMDKVKYQNQFWYLFRSRHYAHGSALGFDAENGPSATISTVKAYGYGTSNRDSRYDINFFSDTVKVDGNVVKLENGTPLIYSPLAVAINLTGSEYEKTAGARMWKYEIDRTAHADGKLQDNDIVLFRYADVLLMRAEAKVRAGESGQSDMDAVRQRAGMPVVTASLDNILNERLLELMWEGSRRHDLVRYGLFNKAYDLRPQLDDEKASAYTTVFPIPEDVIEMNSNLTQNKGY